MEEFRNKQSSEIKDLSMSNKLFTILKPSFFDLTKIHISLSWYPLLSAFEIFVFKNPVKSKLDFSETLISTNPK